MINASEKHVIFPATNTASLLLLLEVLLSSKVVPRYTLFCLTSYYPQVLLIFPSTNATARARVYSGTTAATDDAEFSAQSSVFGRENIGF